MILSTKTLKNAGGVGLFVKFIYLFNVVENFNLKVERYEDIGIELSLAENERCVIDAIYRHPNYNITPFMHKFEQSLSKLNQHNKTYCGAGQRCIGPPSGLSYTHPSEFLTLINDQPSTPPDLYIPKEFNLCGT